jgi:hypothetical protein
MADIELRAKPRVMRDTLIESPALASVVHGCERFKIVITARPSEISFFPVFVMSLCSTLA